MTVDQENRGGKWGIAIAFIAALLAVFGSLYLTIAMHLKACPLCLYERTFAMAVFATLGVAFLFRAQIHEGHVSVMALPMSIGGLGVACFHVYLDRSGKLDCPSGVLHMGLAAPEESLVAFLLISTALFFQTLCPGSGLPRPVGRTIVAATTGLLLAFLCVKSSPPPCPSNPVYGKRGERILSGCEPAAPMTNTTAVDSGQGGGPP